MDKGAGNNQQRKINRPPANFGKKKKTNKKELPMKIPAITPNTRCKLRALRLERIKDFMMLEEEFVDNMIDHRKNIRFLERQIRNLEGNKELELEDENEDDDVTEE